MTKVELPDMKKFCEKLHVSQQEFASSYRIPLATIKNWEQGRSAPENIRLVHYAIQHGALPRLNKSFF